MQRRRCSWLETANGSVGGVGECQERVLQGGGLGPDVLGNEPGAIESKNDSVDEVAGPDDNEVGAVMLDRAHLREGFEGLVGKLIRRPEADPFLG
jgi:hypothetical protein